MAVGVGDTIMLLNKDWKPLGTGVILGVFIEDGKKKCWVRRPHGEITAHELKLGDWKNFITQGA